MLCVCCRSQEDLVEIKVRNETFSVSKNVLSRHSEYFNKCLNGPFEEATKGVVEFEEDMDPKYLALYIGLTYSYSTLVPHVQPPSAESPEAGTPNTALKDFVEVYKLCDRFISPPLADYISKCIDTAIGDGHRALFRTRSDDSLQNIIMREFADGYEALVPGHLRQGEIGVKLIKYFCEGVDYRAWVHRSELLSDSPRFVAHVSRGLAEKLAELEGSRKILKRKELKGP